MKRAAAVVALAAFAGAQTTSSHNGFSFADTVQNASDVVVADIISGAGLDDGTQVTVKATVRVVRVLSGGLAPGAELPLTWQYRPTLLEGPATTSKAPLERGLWFLKREAGDRLVPQQAGIESYYLPAGAAPRYYPANASLAVKIAAEIAPVVEEIATQHAADLTPRRVDFTAPVVIPAWARTRSRFESLLLALDNLDVRAKQEIFADWSARPDLYLKAVGIAGRLNAMDASALIDLEANLATVAPLYESGAIMLHAGGADVRNNLPAARALARLAIGEQTMGGIEGNAAMQLASTRSPEFLPYFVVMLGAPTPWVRGGVLMAFCPLLRDTPLWKAEMQAHCPNHSPLTDTAAEQAEIGFWRSWWDATREQVAKTTALPTVTAPARYSIQPQQPRIFEAPPEIRFMSLLGRANTDHDPIASQFSETDRAAYLEVVAATNAKLAANDKRSEQVMNAARLAGKMPEAAQMKALWDERSGMLRGGLDDLRNRLSPAGRQILEKLFAGMNMVGASVGAPAK